MSIRVVIVGPGRVGAAFGRRFVESGIELCGFVGRDVTATAAAVRFAGGGASLRPADHVLAHALLFAVGDDELEAAVTGCIAAAAPRDCSLWLHTSGCHDLSIFDAAAELGARRGSLHPVAPFADADSGYAAMAGSPAVLAGDDAAMHLLECLAAALGLRSLRTGAGDRTLYHAACALAANGLVVLRGLVDEAFAAAGGLAAADARIVADALMQTAITTAGDHGAAAALSGPVRRGDASTVGRHLAALRAGAPQAAASYRALMQGALRLALEAGLSPAAGEAVRAALAAEETG